MSARIRIGVIGTGFGARVVAPAFAATDGCEVVDVVSARDGTAVARLCARPDLDLLSVHSPPFLHRGHVMAALDAGHAVLCDKPFGRDAADAAAMRDLADHVGVPALVNFEFRHEPARRHVAGVLATGAIGAVEHVSWTHVSAGSRHPLRPHGWLFDRDLGGGWLGAWGAHAVDCLRWWFGDATAVHGTPRTSISTRPDAHGVDTPCDADDGFRADLVFDAGITATIDSTFAAAASIAPRVVVIGTAAVIEVVADRRVTIRRSDGNRFEWSTSVVDGDPHVVPMQAWASEVRDVVRRGVAGAGVPTFADGLAVRRVLDAIRTGGNP